MKNNFICPHCLAQLRVHKKIIVIGQAQNKHKGILLLSPVLGNYESEHHPELIIEKGDRTNFYCPACSKNLVSKLDSDLIMLYMIDENNVKHKILFSRIAGEKASFKVQKDQILKKGEDTPQSDRYFDLIFRYRHHL